MAFERYHGPLGDHRVDQHTGVLASTVANAMRSRKRAYKVEDFIPRWGDKQRKPEQPVEQQLAIALTLNTVFGGRDLRHGHDR